MSIASAAPQTATASSLAQLAENTASGVNGATSGSAASSNTTGSTSSQNALQSLSGNFQDFLQLLMTQMQNQDPTSPMDTNEFTSELVQFSSVEQQIDTNQSLSQLIQLTQGGEILNSSTMVGHQVSVQSNQLTLQNSQAEVQFTSPSAGPAVVAVYNASGIEVAEQTVQATVGQNTWTWDGSTSSGSTAPDGAYTVAVAGTDASGNATTLPFTVVGTATGVVANSNTLELELGGLSVPFSAVQSIGS